MPGTGRRLGTVRAILRQRCPRCHEGPIFRRRLTVNWFCPVCELRLLREPGYTTVAIELSYVFTVPLLIALTALFWSVGLPVERAAIGAAIVFLPLSPLVFRYSRVLWIYLDQSLDPGR